MTEVKERKAVMDYTSIKVPKPFVRQFFEKKDEVLYRSFSEFALECVRNRLKELESK